PRRALRSAPAGRRWAVRRAGVRSCVLPNRLVQHEPVAVDGLDAARASVELGSGRPGEALREGDAVGADELDGVACLEAALVADHADAEERRALFGDRPAGAVVDVEPPR